MSNRMIGRTRAEAIFLLIGDLCVFVISLWATLLIRDLTVPSNVLFYDHLAPFSILFIAWVLVYFIAGLYDNHTTLFKQRLPSIILRAQIVNVVMAALFFFLIPYFGITPKTNLFIYLFVSFGLIVFWRLVLAQFMGVRHFDNALIIASGKEIDELIEEVNSNPTRYGFVFKHAFAPDDVIHSPKLQEQIMEFVDREEISVVVADTRDEHLQELLPVFYNLAYLDLRFIFIDFVQMYEQIFQRMPLSVLRHNWFLEQITTGPRLLYDTLKRLFDILAGLGVCFVTLLVLPFVWLAIRLEDGGPLFIVQERVGRHNQPVKIFKFRTMTGSDSGSAVLKSNLRVTRVGNFLRTSRVDELPQGLNLLKGDVTAIGPRPEFPALASQYSEAIPYYNARHFIKPGLTGWAQIYHQAHPHHGADIEETKNKLSYDLFYIKHRSFMLDIMISLKTIKTLLSRVGR